MTDSPHGHGPVMSDPQGSDRIQQGIPTASGTGANSSTGTDSSFDDVPLTRDEAIERDGADDDLPAHADSDVSRAEGAGSSGDPDSSGVRYDDRTQR